MVYLGKQKYWEHIFLVNPGFFETLNFFVAGLVWASFFSSGFNVGLKIFSSLSFETS